MTVLDVDVLDRQNPLRATTVPTNVLVWSGRHLLGAAEVRPIRPGEADKAWSDLVSKFSARLLAAEKLSSAHSPETPSAQDLTIVVTTRRGDELAGCLETLSRLDPPAGEVVVVDTDSSPASMPPDQKLLSVRYVAAAGASRSAARNLGWQASRRQLVAFISDDARVHARYAAAMAAAFVVPRVGAVLGLVAPAELRTRPQRLLERIAGLGRTYVRAVHDERSRAKLELDRVGAGANLAVRRALLANFGGFDARLDAVVSPGRSVIRGPAEVDLVFRVLAHDWTVMYEPSAVLRRPHPIRWTGLVRAMHDNGSAFSAALAKDELDGRDPATANRERRSWHLRRHVRAPLSALRRRQPWRAGLLLAEAVGSQRARRLVLAAGGENS